MAKEFQTLEEKMREENENLKAELEATKDKLTETEDALNFIIMGV